MIAPLELVQLILGILQSHLGDVLLNAGMVVGQSFSEVRHIRSDDAPEDTPAVVTVSKTECSRQPNCPVEC